MNHNKNNLMCRNHIEVEIEVAKWVEQLKIHKQPNPHKQKKLVQSLTSIKKVI